MALVDKYNQFFRDWVKENKKAYNDAEEKYGVKVVPVADPSQPHWRVIGVHHLTGEETAGKINVYCDILDEKGQRVKDAIILAKKGDLPADRIKIEKPDDEPAANVPMFSHDVVTISVEWPEGNSLPSEQVINLTIQHLDEERGITLFHHAYYVVFQLISDSEAAEPSMPEEGSTVPAQTLPELLWSVGRPLIMPINRSAKFYQVAQDQRLGERLTDEYDLIYEDQCYVAQIYEAGLVYAPAGQWDQTQILPPSRAIAELNITWDHHITGFTGSRWNYWEQYLNGKVPGLTWSIFKDEVLIYNPELATDSWIFRTHKVYKMPRGAGQAAAPAHQPAVTPPWSQTTPVTPTPGTPPPDFVRVVGDKFYLKGKPMRFIGVNIRGLVHYGHDPHYFPYAPGVHRIQQLQEARNMNARLVRVFLAHKDATPAEIEGRLRETLALIKQHFPEIYLLPVLTNLYEDVPFYVRGDGRFYESPPGGGRKILNRAFFAGGYRENYLPFVEHIVKAFKDEPHIFAWEPGNELKAEREPRLFVDFMKTVTAAIKSWDPYHLVTTGMISTRHAWMEDKPDLRRELYRSPQLDFITIHAYNGNEHPPEIEDDSDLARDFRKPFIIEEAGFDRNKYANRPEKMRADMAKWFRQGASCYMPWGFMATDNDNNDSDRIVGMGKALHHDWAQLFELHKQCGHLLLSSDATQDISELIVGINFQPRRDLSQLPWPLLADGFDFPVGKPDGLGYYVAADLLNEDYFRNIGFLHTGEDWNGRGGRDTDLGAPIYSVANGLVITSQYYSIWGNVVLIEHRLPWGQTVWSQYAHLRDRFVQKGEVVRRGDQIGTIGKGDKDRYLAHLHFEIRIKDLPASKGGFKTEADRAKILQAYVHPTNFINSNRPK